MDAISYLDAWSSSNSTAASLFAGLYQADAGLGGPPSLETCIILGLGVLIGSVVMVGGLSASRGTRFAVKPS